MARSIKSPGVEIFETDLSQYQEAVGGTTIFVPGFAPQGPTEETLLVTSISEFEQIYGTPQTAAERYFYHTAREVLNSPATLLTTRLPYGSGSGEGFAQQYSALLFPFELSGNNIKLGKPTYTTLTDEQYEQISQGDVVWSTLSAGVTSIPSLSGKNLDAGLVIINSSKTAINEQFEGYYISITDNAEFGPLEDFTSVSTFYTLTSDITYSQLPQTRLGFSLSASKDLLGSGSMSEVIEGTVKFNIAPSYYNDTLLINVFKIRNSIYEPQILTYSIVESHLGSLDPNKQDLAQVGGIPRSLNLQRRINTTSNNIKLFINPGVRDLDWSTNTEAPAYNVRVNSDVKAVFPNSVYVPRYLNFQKKSNKDIGNVIGKLQRVLSFVETNETVLLDVVLDAGLSTIHTNSRATATPGVSGTGYFDEDLFIDYNDLSDSESTQVLDYRSIVSVFNNFVSNIRKDCVFIADPLRQVFINGENTKIIGLKTTTFTQNIFAPLKNLFETLNSNYSVTYGNWVKAYDAYADKQVWLPFSGFAAAAYARTDTFTQPWIAPAGLTRGIITTINDIAFNPNQKQRDYLYNISINPVVFFSGDGFAIFGQKTLQSKPSAFDRINVRRLFLALERATQSALKYFVFEPNTEFTRTRLKSTITPIFELAKNTEGLYDYLIVCDERNNTPDVIDRNELAVDIYIKPVKAAEFILVNFIATRTGQSFQELL